VTLIAQYRTMLMARAIERRLWVEGFPPVHWGPRAVGAGVAEAPVGSPASALGFEAVQVAAAAALRLGQDWIVPCDKDLALCLALGVTPVDVMLALFARAADPASAGRQAPGAFGSRHLRIVMTSAAAGRHIVQAAGIAYASKVSGRDEVTLVCTDERGTAAGDWHEGINFAGAHSLPFICLVEDKAEAKRRVTQRAEGSPAARAEAYGLAAEVIDGGDFAAALAAFKRAAERARSKRGASLIHASVVDLTAKTPAGGRRPPEELEALAAEDPIDRMRRRLLGQGVLDEATDDHLQRECARVVAAAVDEARAAPSPNGPQALDNVLSRTQGSG
jgi:TPP-dependent pyruvate/acetoin dehydrogenase alpha subunit